MAERVRVREIDDDEGQRLLRTIRRGTGSVVTWRRAQMVLLSAQGMPVAKIAEVTFTSADRVRDVIHNFNTDGFDSLYPKYKGGRPKTFTLPERREIKKIAKSKPTEHDLPFSTWSLTKLADFLVAEGVVVVCDNFSPHLTTKKCQRVGTWAAANNVEIAYTPTNSSWLNRVEAQFTALRYFTLDGTDHASHKEQGSMIRRYIIWRDRHADDQRLRGVVDRANAA
ncbi:transposase [Streptomyces sp. NPDC056178]|uniref:helix-turn-helix domain-containing protein n=1 Tax=Streptomyces sp. NPDC056178 TaxID=3345735 RepID=UPI0035E1FF4C